MNFMLKMILWKYFMMFWLYFLILCNYISRCIILDIDSRCSDENTKCIKRIVKNSVHVEYIPKEGSNIKKIIDEDGKIIWNGNTACTHVLVILRKIDGKNLLIKLSFKKNFFNTIYIYFIYRNLQWIEILKDQFEEIKKSLEVDGKGVDDDDDDVKIIPMNIILNIKNRLEDEFIKVEENKNEIKFSLKYRNKIVKIIDGGRNFRAAYGRGGEIDRRNYAAGAVAVAEGEKIHGEIDGNFRAAHGRGGENYGAAAESEKIRAASSKDVSDVDVVFEDDNIIWESNKRLNINIINLHYTKSENGNELLLLFINNIKWCYIKYNNKWYRIPLWYYDNIKKSLIEDNKFIIINEFYLNKFIFNININNINPTNNYKVERCTRQHIINYIPTNNKWFNNIYDNNNLIYKSTCYNHIISITCYYTPNFNQPLLLKINTYNNNTIFFKKYIKWIKINEEQYNQEIKLKT